MKLFLGFLSKIRFRFRPRNVVLRDELSISEALNHESVCSASGVSRNIIGLYELNNNIMKTHIVVTCLFLLGLFTSCSNPIDDNNNGGNSNLTLSGQWVITQYIDKQKDETSDFDDFLFRFESNGGLIAQNFGNSYVGSWTTGVDDSKSKLIIAFSTPDKLLEISEDWEILSKTDLKLELYHKSGGDGHESFLTLEKQ